jgi:hypothetical protein
MLRFGLQASERPINVAPFERLLSLVYSQAACVQPMLLDSEGGVSL